MDSPILVIRTFRSWFVALSCVSVFGPGSAIAQMPKAITPTWTEVAPGVWKATIGRPESLTLLKAAGGKPALRSLGTLPKPEFPLDQKEIEGRQFNART